MMLSCISAFMVPGWILSGEALLLILLVFTLLMIIIFMRLILLRQKREMATLRTEVTCMQEQFSGINANLQSLIDEAGQKAQNISTGDGEPVQVAGMLEALDSGMKQSHRELKKEIKAVNWHTESLFSLFSILQPVFPLPSMNGWAAYPDFLNLICLQILTRKPTLVLEIGSGISTLITAYCLKRNGRGRVIALDHLDRYADETRELIRMHGLSGFAEVCLAPLKETVIGSETWLWYDMEGVKPGGQIDLMIVDGPPGVTQYMARYPALPLMYSNLSSNAIIVLDDGGREDEKKIIERYLTEYPSFDFRYIDLEKGAFLMTRTKSTAS